MINRESLLILIASLFLSCTTQNHIDINGTWLITDMSFQGQPTYPNTTNRGITDVLQGFEDYETLSFRIVDSTMVLPGFYSENGYASFSVKENRLSITPNKDKTPSELTSLMFGGTYEINYSNSEQRLELQSTETYLQLIHQNEVLSKNIDNLFE